MSWLSEKMGWDKHPDVLSKVNELFDVFLNLFKPKMKAAVEKAAKELNLSAEDAAKLWATIEANL